MIEAAVILSAAAQYWADFFIILLLLIANGVIGFWEEDHLTATLETEILVAPDGRSVL